MLLGGGSSERGLCTLPSFGFRIGSDSRHFLGCSPSRELPRARYRQLSGLGSDLDATSQHPCSLGQPRAAIRNHSASMSQTGTWEGKAGRSHTQKS